MTLITAQGKSEQLLSPASPFCGAQLYRCTATTAQGLPCKPLIAQGETSCRECGADLAQF